MSINVSDLRDWLKTFSADDEVVIEAAEIKVTRAGYYADDGNAEVHYQYAETPEEAAQTYVDGGDWGDSTETSWVTVYVERRWEIMDADGDIETHEERTTHAITIEADVPECAEGHAHDWQSPHSVVGGIEGNPGVQGHDGGVICTEVCRHCGIYRVTDTWAQNRQTGEQGLTSVEYRDADEESLAWVEAEAA